MWENVRPEHVPLLIESADKDAKYSFDDALRSRIVSVVYVVLAMIALAFLVWQLAGSNADLLRDLLTYLAVAAGGFGGGYGYCEQRRKGR